MEEFPHLPKAPIQEALLDFRIKQQRGFDPSVLARIHQAVRGTYPHMDEQRGVSASFEFKPAGQSVARGPVDQGIVGYSLRDAGRSVVAQITADGFTLSKLRPYTSWEDLRDQGHELWKEYVSIAHPEAVTRVAVRYVNRFAIRLPAMVEDYLVKPPQLPDNVEADVLNFFQRVTTAPRDEGLIAIVTQALQTTPGSDSADVILDIDCFRAQVSMDPAGDEAWQVLERLRWLKNMLFFGMVTGKALEMFS